MMWTVSASTPVPDFQREVRPILSGHCFKCHGPDENTREAGLRLDRREDAIRPAESGAAPLVPGDLDASELIRRVFEEDVLDVMPPPSEKRPLSEAQKETLKRWVAAGAEYTPHWAFSSPKQAVPPRVSREDWPRNAIDHFVLARLEREGLQPSPEAGRYTLVRRVYLDLIGLPPTPEEADAFVEDSSPEAYASLVERLLASPHYGERWARRWLDLARYADTNGYEKDRPRSIWPYRDWVINAINSGMPFDQFTIEQIAGDLLSNPTADQRVATGFHRNTMRNEEGGTDPLEYRYYSMVDRVNTTATAWLGLTMECAQCHTHKYDPIQHREYFQMMAFMNNADEPQMKLPDEDIAARRAELEGRIEEIRKDLANRFPVPDILWHSTAPMEVWSAAETPSDVLEDQSVRFGGEAADWDVYTLRLESGLDEVSAIQLEVLPDDALPKKGPGRGSDGQGVLSEIEIFAGPKGGGHELRRVALAGAESDFSSGDQPVQHAVDGKPDTGWLVRGPKDGEGVRTAVFKFETPVRFTDGARWAVRLSQHAGEKKALGRVRVRLGKPIHDDRPIEVRRPELVERKFEEWLRGKRGRTVNWRVLRPSRVRSDVPVLRVMNDDSVFVGGDKTKSDLYEVNFDADLTGITAVRLEALPDDRLPNGGPGRVDYEGPFGDFFLSEFRMKAGNGPVKLAHATHSFANGQHTAANAVDGDPQTGWSIHGAQGRELNAVFRLESPVDGAGGLKFELLCERYYASGLGRFRIAVTTDAKPVEALDLPTRIQELLTVADEDLTEGERAGLLDQFLRVAPELAAEHRKMEELRRRMPEFPTTLVLEERDREFLRETYVHHRGEFTQRTEAVSPDVPEVLPDIPEGAPRNRLTFARWLVDPRNPLTGRVVMNRHWQAFFGTGLVRTLGDFGSQGEPPTHPELLDWLAVEWVDQDWSLKEMHRLIVMSATYRQSSRVTPELLARDPENRLLASGPRGRLEAELVRDLALRASGLLEAKLGGPSVFPPQPPGVSTEGAYGPLEWKTSQGGDRYRRGLYTFMKRTAPYAMFATFDAPSGESCMARREVSNTPLQALTLLNDTVFFEAAQALGRMAAENRGSVEERARMVFRRCLTRPPDDRELRGLTGFYHRQLERFKNGELDAAEVAGPGKGDVHQRAAWAALARVVLNLDETVTNH